MDSIIFKIFLIVLIKSVNATTKQVNVTEGCLEGLAVERYDNNGYYYQFKGIPYADPPIGTLRFKVRSQPPVPWKGVRNATVHGPVCSQYDIFSDTTILGSEDCLFANVYTPDLEPENLLPVVLFIHGGGLKSGSGNDDFYGPTFAVTYNVVVVTINYRLDALGFLCMGTKEVPGNAGLKDQVAAMRWVQKNIKYFGGDASNVTLMGQSAGSSSIALHLVSPMTKELFRRAILMSGTTINDWMVSYRPNMRPYLLGELLGNSTKDPATLLKFLQNVTVDKLLNTYPYALIYEEIMQPSILESFLFGYCIEEDFGQEIYLAQDPIESARSGSIHEVDILFGYVCQEALRIFELIQSTLLSLYNTYKELFVPKRLLLQLDPNTNLNLSLKIVEKYFGNKSIDTNATSEFVSYINEMAFYQYAQRFFGTMPPVGNSSRFFYKLCSDTERNYYGKVGRSYGLYGPAHTDDLWYFFDPTSLPNMTLINGTVEYESVQLFLTLITNFAKYGTPTPDDSLNITWPKYDNETNSCMEIKNTTLTIITNPDQETLQFWDEIFVMAKSNC